MDIVEFLRARLDEDERTAVALQEAYERDEVRPHARLINYGALVVPACVLREVEAKGAIIELHDKWPVLVERPMTIEQVPSTGINDLAFRASQQVAWLTTREYVRQFGGEPPTAPMLAALASIYADHPDYDPDWR